VPVVDVLRAAVAEVEDYVRVDVVSESRDLIAGTAVSDIIHLVAELVENATVFSPPNTRIEVRADRVGTGLVAEIDDRGLGVSGPERDAINQRLASPAEFDLADSDQLGLFIVSRLAARHGIRVSLRESAYGGTTAIVRLPFGVVVRDEDQTPVADESWVIPPDMTAGAAASSAASIGTGRHRLRMAVTGRVADAAGQGQGRSTEPENIPAPRSVPRAPWEMEPPTEAPAAAPEPSVRGADRWRAAPQPPSHGADVWGSAPQPPSRGADRRGAAPQPPARGADAWGTSPGSPSSGSHLGMPIRVPQASMAPQLRNGRPAGGAPAREEPGVDERAPEAVRDMMTRMERGWKRGRLDDLDDAEGAGSSIDW
jgi:anti-sigma regulatory factor (Ser/Thr protein kinase)